MELIEAIGFIQYWGLSPCIDLLEDPLVNKENNINILLCGASDIRHIIHTLSKICDNKEFKNKEINVYFHETQKELIARALLLFHILNMNKISIRERVELFCDVYANCFIKERTSIFLNVMAKELSKLITDEEKCTLPIKAIINLSQLKFKDKDDLLDIFRSWDTSVPFKMEELRDQRLRYHYKDKYDYRANAIDWDYQFHLKDDADIIHYYHYKTWRQTGVAFEHRFSSHIVPNRTMSSYVSGKKKISKESCLVRGFWGDIIVSPYVAIGIETDSEPENKTLFKITNMQHEHHSVDVAEFNLTSYLHKLENFEEYHLPIKKPPQPEEKPKDDKIEEKPEEEEEDKPEEKKEEEVKKEEDPIIKNIATDKLNEIQEESKSPTKPIENKTLTIAETIASDTLLQGFSSFKFKFIPICDEFEKIVKKSNFKNKFNVIVIGLPELSIIKNPDFANLIKPNLVLYTENTKFLVPIKQKERPERDKTLCELVTKAGFKKIDFSKTHHMKFLPNKQNHVLAIEQVKQLP